MNPPLTRFAIGTTMAGILNIEVNYLTTDLIGVPPDGRVPLVGSIGRRANGVLKRDGFKNGKWALDITGQEAFNAFLLSQFGSYTLNSKSLYVSTIDETGKYSPYLCNVERPSTVDGTAIPAISGKHLTPAICNLIDCILQTVTKSANATITTSERFVYVDTSGGSRTMTLPAVAGVTAYTVYSFLKSSASNSMILDGNGSELIAGATTHTSTALNARVDIYTDGIAWYVL